MNSGHQPKVYTKDCDKELTEEEFYDAYRLLEDRIIGEGAFGTVHEGVDKKIPSRQYAIKTIKLVSRVDDRNRVLKEKRCMVRLKDHPNIVKFHNYSIVKSGPYRK